MEIYNQVMLLYGMTFLISLFVALIIWIFAKCIDAIDDENSLLRKLIKKNQ